MSDLDTRKLDKIIKMLSENAAKARVGILGNLTIRDDDSTNATIGAKHEFGQDGMPVRSFLRAPVIENMQSYLNKSDAFTKEALKDVVSKGSLEPWVRKIAFIAEVIIADAFQSGGFGKWTPSKMDHKKNKQTLVETAQLRNSITSDVKA